MGDSKGGSDGADDPDARDARLQAIIAEACLGATSATELRGNLAAFLDRHGIDPADRAAILAAPPRLGLYRRLVRNNLEGVTRTMLPRTRARLNDLTGRFDADFAAFLATEAPRTHHLRDVPGEFLDWVRPRWEADAAVPAYLGDLARHELVAFRIGAAPAHAAPPVGEVVLDRPLRFAAVRHLGRYEHAVHLLPEDEADRTVPEARPVALLAYRDAEHAVRFLDLSPLAAAILERLFAGETLSAALGPACAAHGYTLDDAILADIARLLADLGARGLLLGSSPPS
jgi:hypothetical protein